MSDKRALLAALDGMASKARRSSLGDRLPPEKRGGLTIIVVGGEQEESPAEEIAEMGETETDDEMM